MGSTTFSVPAGYKSVQAIYYENNGYKELARSEVVDVKAPSVNLTADMDRAKHSVNVSWKFDAKGLSSNSDWIALVPSGQKFSNYFTRAWTYGSETGPITIAVPAGYDTGDIVYVGSGGIEIGRVPFLLALRPVEALGQIKKESLTASIQDAIKLYYQSLNSR